MARKPLAQEREIRKKNLAAFRWAAPAETLQARDRPDDEPPLYADIAALLDGTLPEPPTPAVLERVDGRHLFYLGEINYVYGDPEDGKTWVALGAVAQRLAKGGTALFIDLDHNGKVATTTRALLLGAPKEALRDQNRFRYCEPEDAEHLARIIADAAEWAPDVVVVDCVGELMALRGANSDSADEYTQAINAVVIPLVKAGAAVILIDHMAKGRDSRAYGAGGTMAKRRKLGGTSIRVEPVRKFTPGRGGAVNLIIAKDRHGGVTRHCEPLKRGEHDGGTFVLVEDAGSLGVSWHITERRDTRPADADDTASAKPSGASMPFLAAARRLDDRHGSFTVADLAGDCYGAAFTDADRRQTARAADDLTACGYLRVVEPGDGTRRNPRRWRLVSNDENDGDDQ